LSDLDISFVNLEADSVYYKLSVGYDHSDYYQDSKSNLIFLVTREVEVLKKNFGGFNSVDLTAAKAYAIQHQGAQDGGNVYLVTKISIKEINGSYDNVWTYRNIIDFDENSYTVNLFKIYLEDSFSEYNGKLQSRLHINFKTIDSDNGYKLYTLNYINNNAQWQLISREEISTITNEVNHEEVGYCIDTINSNCITKANKFNLTHDYIERLSNRNCY
jgi:hypothetical protein